MFISHNFVWLGNNFIISNYRVIFAFTDLKVDLNHENVAVVGLGNVALDVARILLTPIDFLKKTDITEKALAAISESKVKR